MRRQKAAVLAMVLAAGLSLSACKGGSQEAAAGSEATKEVEQKAEKEDVTSETAGEDQETSKEGKADGENDENEKHSDTVLLAVSFGTSYNDSRDLTIGAVEQAIAEALPQY